MFLAMIGVLVFVVAAVSGDVPGIGEVPVLYDMGYFARLLIMPPLVIATIVLGLRDAWKPATRVQALIAIAIAALLWWALPSRH